MTLKGTGNVKKGEELISKSDFHNEKGVIFVMVLIVIIVSMLLVISIYSLTTTQRLTAEQEYRHLQAEMIAHGEQIRYMGSQVNNMGYTALTYTNIDNRTFTPNSTVDSGAPNNTSTISIRVAF